MSQTGPGLTPGENKPNEVVTNVETERQPVEPTVNEESSAQESQPQPTVKQETQDATENLGERQQEQPESRRAQERIQALDQRAKTAEAQAAYFQQLAQNVFNVQPARPSQEELLQKQFASYDSALGYPTDGKEYAQFVRAQSISSAQQAAQQMASQNEESRQIAEFKSLYPEQDDAFIGAVAGIRQSAQSKGSPMTYAQAAKKYTDDLQKRYAERVKADVVSGETERQSSYVETTGGASTNRKGETTPEFKSASEMERYLKEQGAWD